MRKKIALLGGIELDEIAKLLEHHLALEGCAPEYFIARPERFVSEIRDPSSELYRFKPQAAVILPSQLSLRYPGRLNDPVESARALSVQAAAQLVDLCRVLHERSGTEIVLGNFLLPAHHDPGAYRSRSLGSEWSFRKQVNLELGLGAPPFVRICDIEFLAYRHGGLQAHDPQSWLDRGQPFTIPFLTEMAKEIARLITHSSTAQKKVLCVDLDNTLWGGVIGDDGLEGIQIGEGSRLAEAFLEFQTYLLSLAERGILLAVCSKNDPAVAREPFERHPEMILRLEHFVAFKANWRPKHENIREIAEELGLGLESMVFIDDNPAEVGMMKQFAPEVTSLRLGPSPALYAAQLLDARLFEAQLVTEEDSRRREQYRARQAFVAATGSQERMGSYLEALGMEVTFTAPNPSDLPRITQLINKTNQFHLTTIRRTEAEISALARDPAYSIFSVRLIDKHADHGLIAAVISKVVDRTLVVDTWCMSCRVFQRQIEEETMNELTRIAREHGCHSVKGLYAPTRKNGIVCDLYPKMGFRRVGEEGETVVFELNLAEYQSRPTKIRVKRHESEAAAA